MMSELHEDDTTSPVSTPGVTASSSPTFSTTTTPTAQVLKHRFKLLEQTWSEIKSESSKRNDDASRKQSRSSPVQIIEMPADTITTPSSSSNVFDRLYSHAKDRRRSSNNRRMRTRTSHNSLTSPSQHSIGDTSLSTLSSLGTSSGVFDRLYKNERHRHPSRSVVTNHNDSLSASASLERRLAYRTPPLKQRVRKQLFVEEQDVKSLQSCPILPHTPKRSNSSVFDRLYKNQPRPEKLYKTPPTIQQQRDSLNRRRRLQMLKRQVRARTIQRAFRHYVDRKRRDEALSRLKRQAAARTIQRRVWQRLIRKTLERTKSAQIIQQQYRTCRQARVVKELIRRRFEAIPLNDNNNLLAQTAASLDTSPRRHGTPTDCATILQTAWRCHRAQICLVSKLIASFHLKFDFSSFTHHNGILVMKMGLQSLTKALGQVHCWWIANHVTQTDDGFVEVEWKREVGIYMKHWPNDKVQLETCVVSIKSTARRCFPLESWNKEKIAILVIKATLEKVLAQQRINLQHACAVSIQSWIRMTIATKKYWTRLVGRVRQARHLQIREEAAILLQSWQRSRMAQSLYYKLLMEQLTRQLFELETYCAILIQRVWRAWQCRSQWNSAKHALVLIQVKFQTRLKAVLIQRHVRQFLRRRQFLAAQNAILVIQSWWRCRLALGHCRITKQTEMAAMRIQHEWQRFVFTRQNHKMWIASILLQSKWRRHCVHVRLDHQRTASLRIQANQRQRVTRRTYLDSRIAAMLIQTNWRMWLAQWAFRTQRCGAISIQSTLRQCQTRTKVAKMQSSATVIQTAWRAYMLCSNDMLQKGASILIQAWWRCTVVQKSFVVKRCSAMLIQSMVRLYQMRTTYQHTLKCVIVVQRAWRGAKHRHVLLTINVAALLIQASWRRRLVVNALERQHVAARRIQTSWRSRVAQRNLYRTLGSVSIIQAAWRRYSLVARYQNAICCCIMIQSQERCHRARTNYISVRQDCIKLQSVVRTLLAQEKLKLAKAATTLLQTNWRATQARKDFESQRVAALLLQAAVRRQIAQRRFHSQLQTIVLLQSQRRSFSDLHRYRLIRCSTVIIQKNERQRQSHSRFATIVANLIVIQSMFRAQRVRTQVELARTSAIIIQTWFRLVQCKMALSVQRISAMLLQSSFRKWNAQSEYKTVRAAVLLVQSSYRGSFVRKNLHLRNSAALRVQVTWYRYRAACDSQKLATEKMRNVAAILLQRIWRRRISRWQFIVAVDAAVSIQTSWRSSKYRRAWNSGHVSVFLLQSCFRKWKAQAEYESVRAATKVIQRNYRVFLCRLEIASLHRSARAIQAAWRRHSAHALKRHLVEVKAREVAATALQRIWRLHTAKWQWFLTVDASKAAQRTWRSYISRQNYHRLRLAAVKIQRLYRRHLSLSSYQKMIQSCISIQALARAKLARTHIDRMSHHAVRIQSIWRALSPQRALASRRRCAVLIQAIVRHWQARTVYNAVREHVLSIQRAYRRFRCETEYRVYRDAASLIQCAWRHYLRAADFHENEKRAFAAHVIQMLWRKHRFCRSRIKSAVLIQRYWRCVLVSRDYDILLGSAVTIQRYERRRMARERFLRLVQQCTVIQAIFRGSKRRKQMNVERRCAVAIQGSWRRSNARRKWRLLRSPAVLIQSTYRRHACQIEYDQFLRKIALVQSLERRRQARSRFVAMLQAASIIQRMWFHRRAETTAKQSRSKEHSEDAHNSAYMIQKLWRVQAAATVRNGLALRIQAAWKSHRSHKMCSRIVAATILIQRSFRRRNLRKLASERRLGCILIQAQARRRKVLRLMRNQIACASQIQMVWRMHCARRNLLAYLKAACTIQAFARERETKIHYVAVRDGITSFQGSVRRTLVRKQMESREVAKIAIQKPLDRHKTANSTRAKDTQAGSEFSKEDSIRTMTTPDQKNGCNALTWQSLLQVGRQQRRAQLSAANVHVSMKKDTEPKRERAGCTESSTGIIVRSSALSVQRKARTYMLKHPTSNRRGRDNQSRKTVDGTSAPATSIQSAWRAFVTRRVFCRQRFSAAIIQVAVRGLLARKIYQSALRGAVVIQSCVRVFLSVRLLRNYHLAATRIQAMLRCTMARQLKHQNKSLAESSTIIQASWRMVIAKRRFQETALAAAVTRETCPERQTISTVSISSVVQKHTSTEFRSAVIILSTARRSACRKELGDCQRLPALAQQTSQKKESKEEKLGFSETGRPVEPYIAEVPSGLTWQSLLQAGRQQANRKVQQTSVHTERRLETCQQSSESSVALRVALGFAEAAVRIQSAWRGNRSQRFLSLSHASASLSQERPCNLLPHGEAARLSGGQVLKRSGLTTDEAASAVTIQNAWRSKRQNRIFASWRSCAVIIQAYHRMSTSRRFYLTLLHGSLIFQRAFRSYRGRREHRLRDFPSQEGSIDRFNVGGEYAKEATERSASYKRGQFQRESLAASKIQKAYNSWKVQSALLYIQSSAILLERSVRGELSHSARHFALDYMNRSLRSKAIGTSGLVGPRKQFSHVGLAWMKAVNAARESACILIQSAVRRMMARNLLRRKLKKTITSRPLLSDAPFSSPLRIKAFFCSASTSSLEFLNATIAVQSFFRMHRDRTRYREFIGSVVTLQSKLRAARESIVFGRCLNSAVRIQRAWRGHRLKCHHRYIVRAAVVIQAVTRMLQADRAFTTNFGRCRNAAVLIQRAWRGHMLKCHDRDIVRTAVVIQAVTRMLQADRAFTTKSCAACTIQRTCRSWMQTKQYVCVIQSVRSIQRVFRCHLCARKSLSSRAKAMLSRRNVSAMHLQRVWRRYHAASVVAARKQAVASQAAARRLSEQEDLCYKLAAAFVIQRAILNFHRRQEVARNGQAILLQRTVRRHQCGIRYMSCRNAAILLQGMIRLSLSKRRSSALCIETIWRSYSARTKFLDLLYGVAVLQSVVRMWLARCCFLQIKAASSSIQLKYRAARKERDVKTRHAAVTLQRYFRSTILLRNYTEFLKGLRLLQSEVRRSQTGPSIRSMRDAASLLQASFRRWCCQVRYKEMRRSDCLLKACSPMAAERSETLEGQDCTILNGRPGISESVAESKELSSPIAKEQASAILVQSKFRSFAARSSYDFAREKIVYLQAISRGAARQREFAEMLSAAATVQRFYRSINAELAKRKRDQAAIVFLQSIVRRQQALGTYNMHRRSSIVVQREVRRILVRTAMSRKRDMAARVQTLWRRYKDWKSFSRFQRALVILQSRARRRNAMVIVSAWRKAAISVQSAWRCWHGRRHFLLTMALQRKDRIYMERAMAATVFQRIWRTHSLRRRFLSHIWQKKLGAAATLVQARARCLFSKTNYGCKRLAAVRIQCLWRHWVVVKAASVARLKELERKVYANAEKQARDMVASMLAVGNAHVLERSDHDLLHLVHRVQCARSRAGMQMTAPPRSRPLPLRNLAGRRPVPRRGWNLGFTRGMTRIQARMEVPQTNEGTSNASSFVDRSSDDRWECMNEW